MDQRCRLGNFSTASETVRVSFGCRHFFFVSAVLLSIITLFWFAFFLFLCFITFLLFHTHLCGRTRVHGFHIFYGHTEWCLLFFAHQGSTSFWLGSAI